MVPGENNQIVAIQGMCATATAAADEPRALCIVRDMTAGQWDSNKIAINLPVSTTATQLMEEVGRKFRYDPETFELVLQRICDNETVSIHEHSEETLEEMGFRYGDHSRNSLIIANKNLMQPKRVEDEEGSGDSSLHYMKSKFRLGGDSYYVPPPAPPPYTPGSSEFSYNYLYSNALTRQDTGFVGLVNQAMTCYLNSLLQTLFMTPEFRNTLYRWEFDGTEDEGTKSIPFQLQKLFLQLQTSKKPAVGTTELTTSFGWDSSEAWQQHDVQELCRVMFDALEQKFKNTRQADLISRLYEGKLKDYVKCLECSYESAREDTFLDVPLVVRPFGSSQAYASVEEALHAFVTPEILEGSNQYFCEQCNKKCDAHKGLKFTKFPYLLTLQLKRFDFDPLTMHRIKLNDRVSFPEILNLNDFILDKIICYPDDDEGIDVGEKNKDVYELFSIMVHSGSANGGHYYAYIKAFCNGEWYCFNDAQVSRITYEDIQKTYGGSHSRGHYSSAYSSSTNAYMLMYRQVDKLQNTDCMAVEDFPEHVKDLLQCMQEQEERERQQRELDRSMCKIKLFCQHPVQQCMVDKRLKVHKDSTLAETTATARTVMGLDDVVDLECCRLVKYDDFSDSLEWSFEGSEQEPVGELLACAKPDLLLEIRKPMEQFQEYKPGGTTIKAHRVDLEREEVALHPLTLRSHPTHTVAQLKAQIGRAMDVDAERLRLVLETKLLDDPAKTLGWEGFRKSNKLYVECGDEADARQPYATSRLFRVLDRHAHTICLYVALPTLDKATLERLRIQDEGRCDSSDEEKNEEMGGDSKVPLVVVKDGQWWDKDEGLGDSDVNGYQNIHSDQSEDSSLTDSERTLIGEELSPRNNSPDEPECDINCSEERRNLSSPEENTKCSSHYFKAWPYTDSDGDRMLRVYVDKRITLGEVKKELEPYIGVGIDCFKLYRAYSNSQEFECTRMSDNLMSYGDDNKLTVKIGRALRKGEYKVKIYQLCVNEPEPFKYLVEWVLLKGMTVLKAKKEILPEIKERCSLDIPLNRCRLRSKSWKNPGRVYLDHQKFGKDIAVNANWEMYLQVLTDAETVTSVDQHTFFVRRWHPSTYVLEPAKEIVLNDFKALKERLSEVSEIPPEFVEFAKGPGTFPYQVSLLTIHRELEWHPQHSVINTWTLSLGDDGHLIYYKDKREELKKLTEEEKREIANKENARSSKNHKSAYSPRKEKALKIYTMDSPPMQGPDLD